MVVTGAIHINLFSLVWSREVPMVTIQYQEIICSLISKRDNVRVCLDMNINVAASHEKFVLL